MDSIQIHSDHGSLYGYVKFEFPVSTTKVLSTPNSVVNLRPADSDLHNASFSLDLAMNSIYKLNDDCLRDIFWHLSLKELGIVADVCVRFRRLAKELFASKFKNVLDANIFREYADFEPVLRNFGPTIQSIALEQKNGHTTNRCDVLTLIYQFCAGLKNLKLTGFTFPDHLNTFHLLFDQLEQLTINNCHFPRAKFNLKCILSRCTKLRMLDIERYVCGNSFEPSQLSPLPQLRHVRFYRCGFSDLEMSNFISSQKVLKKLSIVRCFSGKEAFKTIHEIGEKMKELEALEFDEDQNHQIMKFFMNAIGISDEPFLLKVLKFNCSMCSITPLLKVLVEKNAPIEYLKLKRSELNSDEINCIKKMRQIKVLDIFDSVLVGMDMEELAISLPNLQELHLTKARSTAERMSNITIVQVKKMLILAKRLSCLRLILMDGVNINMKDYDEILAILQKRQDHIKLVIMIADNNGHVDVPESILSQNRHLLNIEECFLFQRPF